MPLLFCAALCLFSDHRDKFPLQLDKMIGFKTVWETQLDRHPHGCPLDPCAVIPPVLSAFDPHPVFFERITGSLICSIALHVDGAAGSSNLDAHGWYCICASYHGASAGLYNVLTIVLLDVYLPIMLIRLV